MTKVNKAGLMLFIAGICILTSPLANDNAVIVVAFIAELTGAFMLLRDA